ncbi:MAG: alpha-glucosidase [Bacilli bacterium]
MSEKLNREYNKYVAYQIYPMSFCDSNNDGIGDINGIRSKLDYLVSLGIDMIWICPIFASPMDDNGYDVSNFYAINPMFGTFDDFKNLIKEAHEKNIKIILDLVLNHTSSEHEWFKKAISDVNCPEHGYYYFKKGKINADGKREPPNNWASFFSTSAREYVPAIDEYYLHIFSSKMPDLNYTNPLLMEEMKKVAAYWLDLGIDGYRIDAVAHLAKDTSFADSTLPVDANSRVLDFTKFSNREELFDYLNELSTGVFKPRNAFIIGEVGGCATSSEALKYSRYNIGPANMVFNFDTCWENGAYGSITKEDNEIVTNVWNLKHLFLKWYRGCYKDSDMPLYWNNHDHPRVLSQYGSVKYRKESGKMLITTLLFMYGLPFILYGDELGMSNADYTDLNDFKDINDVNFRAENTKYTTEEHLRFARRCSRSNGRLPFCWKNDINGGFSKVSPSIKSPGYFKEVNKEDEDKDPNSVLNYYRNIIKLRHQNEIIESIIDNEFELVDENNVDVFAYSHFGSKMNILVISNFRDFEVDFNLIHKIKRIIIKNYEEVKIDGKTLKLRPFESVIFEVEIND